MDRDRSILTGVDPRWQSVLGRDTAADGRFVFAVKTTGVYCRPGCPARTAKRENVAFFATCDDAERAGYRACRRCHPNAAPPDAMRAALVARACRLIEAAEDMPKLGDLAAAVDTSPSHFHRQFKAVTGLTPKAYGAAHRAQRIRRALVDPTLSVTAAIYDAGFNSHGRFYATSNEVLGMTPTAYKNGGAATDILFAVGRCSLGAILVARSAKGICAIFLGDDPDALSRELQERFPKARLTGGDAGFDETIARVIGFVEAPQLGLDLRGTAFQQRVWQALQAIPPGQTTTYTEIARKIGEPKAVRAVAQACGANKVAVAIPCHRVVRRDGALSGYRWGVGRKKALLDREGDPSS